MKTRKGFSLLELLIVVAIMVTVAVIAMPRFTTFLSTYRLRSSVNQYAGTLQQTRMQAVRLNTVVSLSQGTANGETIVWGNLPGGTANWDPGEPFVQLPRSMSIQNSGFPGDATTGLGFTAQTVNTAVVRFNSRGLPCVYPSGNTICENNDGTKQVGFVVYFQNAGSFGVPGWGAVTITPAGRIRTWVWDGTSYTGQ